MRGFNCFSYLEGRFAARSPCPARRRRRARARRARSRRNGKRERQAWAASWVCCLHGG